MRKIDFDGSEGIRIAAEECGPKDGAIVLLLHDGGQTRGSWRNGMARLAAEGYRAIAIDLRGHGESDWSAKGDYSLTAFANDLRAIVTALPTAPAIVGASMGGLTALSLLGEGDPPPARALVLVDVAPRVDLTGARRIVEFMSANKDGFASVEEAADAVSIYNPHRRRPKDVSGLRRNLRELDGRLYWHWDPKLLGASGIGPEELADRMDRASMNVHVPTMLVRGLQSDLVGEKEIEHFRRLMPDARYVSVAGAGHMVAGDRNDAFNDAVIEFLMCIDKESLEA